MCAWIAPFKSSTDPERGLIQGFLAAAALCAASVASAAGPFDLVIANGRVVVDDTTATLKRDGVDLHKHLGIF